MICEATPLNYAEIMALVKAAKKHYDAEILNNIIVPLERELKMWKRGNKPYPNFSVFVKKKGNSIIGVSTEYIEKNSRLGDIGTSSITLVHPSHQGTGVGTEFYKDKIERWKRRGCAYGRIMPYSEITKKIIGSLGFDTAEKVLGERALTAHHAWEWVDLKRGD